MGVKAVTAQCPHQRREGPTAGHSEPCLAPRGADPPKPTFSRGIRPWLWFAAAPGRKHRRELSCVWWVMLPQEPGQALPQPQPPEIWVPTAKRLVSTCLPLHCGSLLPTVSHHCCTALSSHRNAAGAAGTTHHQHFIQRVLAHAMCHHGTGRKGSWGRWRSESPELWGHSAKASRAHGASHMALTTATANHQAHSKPRQHRQSTLGTQSHEWPKKPPKTSAPRAQCTPQHCDAMAAGPCSEDNTRAAK